MLGLSVRSFIWLYCLLYVGLTALFPRRESANAVQEQGEERVEARIDRLEKALLSAIKKKNSPASQEKEKLLGLEKNQLQIPSPGKCYGRLESKQPEYELEPMENKRGSVEGQPMFHME